MADHIWTVFCERAIFDQTTNSASLIDVIEQIGAAPIPPTADGVALPANIFGSRAGLLISLWTRSDPSVSETARGRTYLLLPNGKQVGKILYDLDLTKSPRFRLNTNVPNLPIIGPGRYSWTVQLEKKSTSGKARWATVATIPFDVTIQDLEKPVADAQQTALPGAKKKSKKTSTRGKKKLAKSKRQGKRQSS